MTPTKQKLLPIDRPEPALVKGLGTTLLLVWFLTASILLVFYAATNRETASKLDSIEKADDRLDVTLATTLDVTSSLNDAYTTDRMFSTQLPLARALVRSAFVRNAYALKPVVTADLTLLSLAADHLSLYLTVGSEMHADTYDDLILGFSFMDACETALRMRFETSDGEYTSMCNAMTQSGGPVCFTNTNSTGRFCGTTEFGSNVMIYATTLNANLQSGRDFPPGCPACRWA